MIYGMNKPVFMIFFAAKINTIKFSGCQRPIVYLRVQNILRPLPPKSASRYDVPSEIIDGRIQGQCFNWPKNLIHCLGDVFLIDRLSIKNEFGFLSGPGEKDPSFDSEPFRGGKRFRRAFTCG